MGHATSYDQDSRIAEYYELIPVSRERGDVNFYLECARRARGKVLELGCGTGRILLPLAAAGIEIVGVDLSESMLAKCQQKLESQPPQVRERVRLICGSMTDFNLGESFDLVMLPFRPFQHLLTVDDQQACLRAVNHHLRQKGRLVFDVFQPDFRHLHDPTYRQETEEVPEVACPGGQRIRVTSRVLAFHPAEQYNQLELIFYITHPDGRRERFVHAFSFRYFFRYELEHLLARGGFRVVELYGNFDKSPLRDDSPEMIFVAEKSP